MADGRYYNPTDLLEAAGGLPGYNPYSKHFQLGTAFGGIRNLLQQLMQMKMLQEQRQWERNMAQSQLDLATQKVTDTEEHNKILEDWHRQQQEETERYHQAIEDLRQQDIGRLIKAEKARERRLSKAEERKARQGNKPSAFEQKEIALRQMLERGEITPEQFKQVMYGLSPVPTGEEYAGGRGAPSRQANEATLSKYRSENPDLFSTKRVRKRYLEIGDRPKTETGYILDMPFEYNVALKNVADGVATQKDKITVQYYDKLYNDFMTNFLPKYPDFKSFMQSEDAKIKGLKKDWIKVLYDIYRR